MNDAYGCSDPRDMTGTPAHLKLRAALGVPPGGRRPKRPAQPRGQGDVKADMTGRLQHRATTVRAATEAKALAAHERRREGATLAELRAEFRTNPDTIRKYWRRLGLTDPLSPGTKAAE